MPALFRLPAAERRHAAARFEGRRVDVVVDPVRTGSTRTVSGLLVVVACPAHSGGVSDVLVISRDPKLYPVFIPLAQVVEIRDAAT